MKTLTFKILLCTILALNLPYVSSLNCYDGTCMTDAKGTNKDCVKKHECGLPYNPVCLKISGSTY